VAGFGCSLWVHGGKWYPPKSGLATPDGG
jgi:hypothetical protein